MRAGIYAQMPNASITKDSQSRGAPGDRFIDPLDQPLKWDPSRIFNILSLDGGGIKGLNSAALLAHVEEDLGCAVTDHFDLIAGTSTGAIIAAALGLGMRPKDIVRFYVERGPTIFPATTLQNKRANLRHIFRRKFDSAALEENLRECIGERILGESTKRLVIPAYDIGRDDVCLFKTPHHPRFMRDHRLPAWQVVMASAAAPSYFPAVRSIEHRRLIDGGVWANNPVMVAITEAIGVLGVPVSNIRVLSIGTTDPLCMPPEKLDKGGQWTWKAEAVRVALRGQSIGAINQARLILGNDRVVRVDPVVPDGMFALDKLDVTGHLSLAAHESRIAMPAIAPFMRHVAAAFTPFYGPLAKQQMEVTS